MPNTVLGTNNSETIDALDGVTNGADTIYGFGGNDTIFGLGGRDEIKGGGGADAINGGGGSDIANYSDSSEGVSVSLASGLGQGGTAEGDTLTSIENLTGSAHDDVLVGDGGDNELRGLDGNDTLKGGGGSDTLFGNGDSDLLKGGGGADELNGGSGIDTATYSDSPEGVFISLIDDTADWGDAEGDELNGIENVTGSDYSDTLWGNDGINVLRGLDGNDFLMGFGGDDTLWGGNNNDSLYGREGVDVLQGENGDDFIDGGAGADTMIGGLGNDTYMVDHAFDVVMESGGQGFDIVHTNQSWTMTAGADIESLETDDPLGVSAINLTGNAAGNRIIGNNGNNRINGGAGVDEMIGLGGNDLYYVDNVDDSVTEFAGDGADEVRTSIDWTLTAGADVETLRTTNDAGVGAINLTGNASGNVVLGNNGNNVLAGGDGDDELTGLAGQDSFLFDTPLSEAFNIDVITDFNVADDTIRLDDDIFSSGLGLGNISAGEFVIGTEALDGNDRIIYDDTTGALYYDADSAGGADAIQFATLSTGLALTYLDFFVVA
jgi:Ca2+-binding RTX toxin-like protein